MLNLNLNILGASNKPIVPIAPAPAPTTTTTTSTTTTTTTTTTVPPVSFRNDPYSASLLFATPGNQFTSLGMSLSYSDVHADIAGVGSNFTVNTGSFADATYTNFSADGYVTSTRVESSGSFFNQNNSDFQFTSENLTIETWIYGLDTDIEKAFYSDYRIGNPPLSGIWVSRQSSNRLRFITSVGSSEFIIQSAVLDWDDDQWYHIAFVKNGTTYTIYRDGVEVASSVVSGDINTTTNPKRIMGFQNASEGTVWVQDYKIYKGAAVYTSSFTPPPSMVQ
jgi:hypothetical protein